jgi:sulfite exporter TauE/SafE
VNPCCSAGLDPAEPVQGLLLFGTGLAISAGHCGGMCGPLVAAFGVARGAGRARGRVVIDALVYHLGRVLSYAALGAVFGGGAAAARAALPGVDLRSLLSLAAGLALIAPAFTLLATAGAGTGGPAAGPARALLATASRLSAPARRAGPLGLGVANGFLPCGPVALVALGAASAGDPWRGALSLATFGAGTVPVLVVLTFGAATLRLRPRPALARVGSLLLLALAVQLSLRGLAALGYVPHAEVGPWPLW